LLKGQVPFTCPDREFRIYAALRILTIKGGERKLHKLLEAPDEEPTRRTPEGQFEKTLEEMYNTLTILAVDLLDTGKIARQAHFDLDDDWFEFFSIQLQRLRDIVGTHPSYLRKGGVIVEEHTMTALLTSMINMFEAKTTLPLWKTQNN